MYLCDSDIIIWILRGNQRIADAVSVLVGKTQPTVSAITVAEVYQHVFPKEIPSTEKLFSTYNVYSVDASIARAGGLYWQHYCKRFATLSIADCIIAATAREHNLTLATLNTRHFPMDDIKLYKGKLLSVEA